MAGKNDEDKVCPASDKSMIRSQSSPANHWIYRHPIKTLVLVLAILLLLPFLIVAVIKGVDGWFPGLQFARLNDGINIWLSFWGSYLGCVATVILSVGAIFLNEKVNRYTWHKNTADQIGEFNNFEVESISLYHTKKKYPEKEMARIPDMNYEAKFLLTVTFQKPFPPHYQVDINKICLCKDYDALDTSDSIDIKFTSLISNAGNTQLHFLADDKSLGEFYCYPLTGQNTSWKEKHYWLRLQLNCENRLYSNRQGYYQPLQVTLDLWLFNDSIKDDTSANVEVEERKIFCVIAEE